MKKVGRPHEINTIKTDEEIFWRGVARGREKGKKKRRGGVFERRRGGGGRSREENEDRVGIANNLPSTLGKTFFFLLFGSIFTNFFFPKSYSRPLIRLMRKYSIFELPLDFFHLPFPLLPQCTFFFQRQSDQIFKIKFSFQNFLFINIVHLCRQNKQKKKTHGKV